MQLVIFTLDQEQFALRLDAVEGVVHAVGIGVLPKAPQIVDGIVNVHGRVIPVVNVRRRFNLPERDVALTDKFILAHTARRPICLVVDTVTAIGEYPDQSIEEAGNVLPNLEYVAGIMRLPEGVVFIHDLDEFLSLEEEASLERALA